MTTTRIAVIGDVGGHVDQLRAELARLGVPDGGEGPIPSDLVVVQVGDLVHRGPDSAAVVDLVDRHLTATPGRWRQLVGNHEALYVDEPRFHWPDRIPAPAAAVLHRWWAEGQMLAAAAFTSGNEQFLVTHAGLTQGFWADVLGAPRSAAEAAEAINALVRRDDSRLFRSGHLLDGGRPDLGAGPLWAVAATELVPSWSDVPVPFSQIHGHTSLVDWRDDGHANAVPPLADVDAEAKHATAHLEGGRIIGVDPGHTRQPRVPWRAWEASL